MNGNIANEIQAAQDHGRSKYGSGPNDYAHDDAHSDLDWHVFIERHNRLGEQATPRERREYLIKVAGLAVSAVESFDRKP